MALSRNGAHLPVQGTWRFNPGSDMDELIVVCAKLMEHGEYVSTSILQSSESCHVIGFDARLRYADNQNIASVMKTWADGQEKFLKESFGSRYYGRTLYLEVWTSDKA